MDSSTAVSRNNFLMKTVFDGKGNYIYYCKCIKNAFNVGTVRLARIHKVVQEQHSHLFYKWKKNKLHDTVM